MSMREFQERKEAEKMIFSTPVLLIVIVMVGVGIFGVARLWRASLAARADLAEMERKIEEVRKKRNSLNNDISKFTMPEGIEMEARTRFNLKKDGEEVAVFIGDGPSDPRFGFGAASLWRTVKSFLFQLIK